MSMSSVAITAANTHAALPLGFSRARYHYLDTNAPRLASKIQDVQRHLDPEANRQKLLKLQEDLASQGLYSITRGRLADGISKLQRFIDSPSAHSQLEWVLAELEDQQMHEMAELASYYGKLPPSRAQTLLPDVLSEIFRQCGAYSPQSFSWGPLDLEMRTLVNILRVCSSWRAVALGTPDLWSKLTYADTGTLPLSFYDQWLSRAAAVTLDLQIWPSYFHGDENYWSGATALLHKYCNTIEKLELRLPVEGGGPLLQPLFPHPHRPTSLRKLTVHSYDALIHSTLSNIPWSQLSSIEFRVQYDTRVVSPSQLASILSQAHNLTNLLINTGPDLAFAPSSAQVLPLQNLRSLEISWIDSEEHYPLGIVPHSFIDLFDKLRAPALKSLGLTVDKHVNPYVLPALTGLASRSGFALESLRIAMSSPTPTALSSEGTIAFLREQVSLKSLHLHLHNCDLPELLEALTYSGLDSETLLSNLVDISIALNSYEGLLPAFADMAASRQAAKSLSQSIAALRSFHLKGIIPYREPDDNSYYSAPEPLLGDEIKEANEKASCRLLDLAKQCLSGSLDFQHFDQTLKFTEPNAMAKNFRRNFASGVWGEFTVGL